MQYFWKRRVGSLKPWDSRTASVEVTSAECKKLVKDKLVVLLNESFHLVPFQNKILQQMKTASTKNKPIESEQ